MYIAYAPCGMQPHHTLNVIEHDKKALIILQILIFIVGCSAEKKLDMTDNKLVEGTFYLNKKLSNDTLRFQLDKFDKGGWNNTVLENNRRHHFPRR